MRRRANAKGNLDLFLNLGLPFHQEILICFPQIFDYSYLYSVKKDVDFKQFFNEALTNMIDGFQKLGSHCSIKKILSRIWPVLICQVNPIKFQQQVKYISKQLNLTPEHACIMIHFNKELPDKYPQFFVKNTLQIFEIKQNSLNNQLLLDLQIGKQCLQAYTSISQFEANTQIISSQQNQYGQQQFKPSSISTIVQKMLQNVKTICQVIRNVRDQKNFINQLSVWLKVDKDSDEINLWRTLKIILSIEGYYQFLNQQNHNNVINKSLQICQRMIINEVAERMLHRLFSRNTKQKLTVLSWILQSRIFKDNQALQNILMYFLIASYELQTLEEQNKKIHSTQEIQTILNAQFKLMQNYIYKIKKFYFNKINFNQKVPKSFLSINLKLLNNYIKQQKQNILLKNGETRTLSMQKMTSNQQINSKQNKSGSQNQMISNFDKFLASLTKYGENLQLTKIFIICLVLQHQLSNYKQNIEKTNKSNNPKRSRNSLKRIIYQLVKIIKKYEQIFESNMLSLRVIKIASGFAPMLTNQSIGSITHTELSDLNILNSGKPCFFNLSKKILARKLLYKLTTIYEIQMAQQKHDKCLAQNKKPQKRIKITTNTMQDLNKELINEPKLCQFRIFVLKLMHLLQQYPYEKQFFFSLVQVQDLQIVKTLMLNFIYSFLTKLYEKRKSQAINQSYEFEFFNTTLHHMFYRYFTKQNRTYQQNQITDFLTKIHKIFSNWNKCARRSITNEKNSLQNLSNKSIQAQMYVATTCWNCMIFFQTKSRQQLKKYAKCYEQFNCIKQSLYLLQLSIRKQFPPVSNYRQASWLFSLYQRLDNDLSKVKNQALGKFQSIYKQNTKNLSNFDKNQSYLQQIIYYYQLKSITDDSQINDYSSILQSRIMEIYKLEDFEQIDKMFNLISIFSKYFQCLKETNYHKLSLCLDQQSNDRTVNLSIIRSLCEIKDKLISQTNSLPSYLNAIQNKKQTTAIISKIIYSQRLKLNQIDTLRQQIESINIQNMSPQMLRIAVIVYHKLQQYEKVKQCYKQIDENLKQMKQQLQFYNIEASYRSIMYFQSSDIIISLQKIVNQIVNQKQSIKITRKFTQPLFLIFKFICENYSNLSLKQQSQIVSLLTSYLNKCKSIQNQQLSIEACYFILRYLLIQSKNVSQLCSNSQILKIQKLTASIIQPHLSLIISSIGTQHQVNLFIGNLLTIVAKNDPKGSVWWIYGLKQHCKPVKDFKKQGYDLLDEKIEQVGQFVIEQLKLTKINIQPYLGWIDWFSQVGEKEQKILSMPTGMVSPFSKKIILESIQKIQGVGSGKSKPIIIQCKVQKQNRSIYFIKKNSSSGKCGFRTESATANFFKDCCLLDRQVTYSIIHLRKYCLLVEYIQNQSTLDKIMTTNLTKTQTQKIKNMIMEKKDLKILSHLYQNSNFFINFNMQKYFFHAQNSLAVNHWWQKYTNFVRTYAQWCFLGYIVGLGDRHTNNALVTKDGKIIQIDFQFIFDIGKTLQCPQWVPFRLTRGMLQQLSAIQPYGLIYSQFVKTAQKYKQMKRQIWHALSHFSYLKKKDMSRIIDKKAQLNNQPLKKALKLIQQATDPILLRTMFFGWGSFK